VTLVSAAIALLMLHGAIGNGFDAELLSYEAPTYFGMLTAGFAPRNAAT
jgi:hypothetical protein